MTSPTTTCASTPNTAAEGEARELPVAAAALRNARGEVLLAERAPGKPYAGMWELPGGKLEAGETALDALRRELDEELGITVADAAPLIRLRHAYPEFTVALDVFEVDSWQGTPRPREGQRLAWVAPQAMHGWPLLPADAPIVTALRLPACYAITPPELTPPAVLAGLDALPAGCLLRLRLPSLSDSEYAALAGVVCASIGGGRLVVDRDPALADRLGCRLHLNGAALRDRGGVARPTDPPLLVSIHDAAELRAAEACGAEAVVLGPVAPTASHPGARPLDWAGFAAIAASAAMPVYAIGGMTPTMATTARRHGGQGVAGIGAFWPAAPAG